MIINIGELVNNKIKELEEGKKIEKAIEETLEKTILSAVKDAINSYELKRNIGDKLKKQVSELAKTVGFEGYNTFVAEKMKQIIDGTCKKDLEEKIQESFNNLLITKRDSIKLSEIFEAFREWISEDLEEREKYGEGFYVSLNKSSHGWYNVVLAEKEPAIYSEIDVTKFTVHIDRDGNGLIGCLYLNGDNVEKSIPFGYLNKFESLIINLKYNKTPIIIDVEDEDDIDASYICDDY